jgi:hypothetical protein
LIKRKRKTAKTSLRYEVIDGKFRRYKDGREVCLDTEAGKAEYRARTWAMVRRQTGYCSRGRHVIRNPTFDHSTNSRGMGGAKRDDRIVDEHGNQMNSCSCYSCNGQAGSKRIE